MCIYCDKLLLTIQFKRYTMNLLKSFLCFLVWAPLITYAQKNTAVNAVASFSVNTPIREISGENKHTSIEMDFKTGIVKAHMQVDSFQFPDNFSSGEMNNIIRSRFRQYYMESNLYPVMTFDGKITNMDKDRYKANGSYPLDISGYLTLHGIKKYITVQAILTVNGSRKSVVSDFAVEPESYKIRLPDYNVRLKEYFNKVNIRISAELKTR